MHPLRCFPVLYSILIAISLCHLFTNSANSDETGVAAIVPIGPFETANAPHHQTWIQQKLDESNGTHTIFVFAPGEYVISDPHGIQISKSCTLQLEGAIFKLAESLDADGQCFLLENVSNVSFRGGTIIGQRERWDPGTNIAGIRVFGESNSVRIEGTAFRDLSSNGVGFFGNSDDAPIRHVVLRDVAVENCCNYYGDYLSQKSGPAPGSDRKDQGGIAMYHVEDWLVDGCRFSSSQSDGTHFYHSRDGRFVNSIVENSQMGGYFLEGCRNVIASANIIRGNGSRGVTIERNSMHCILSNCTVETSGREGLWAPDVEGIIVSSNIFRENGRKDDAEKDCEIRLDNSEQFTTDTRDIQIYGNIFYTGGHQTAAIFLGKNISGISIDHNMFRGDAPKTYTESEM